MASTTYLQQAYLAYFGRPADVSGLSFYADKSEAAVVAAFSASTESQAFFGSLNTLAQINTIYQNLFNRAAEPAGLTYWAGEINAGRLSLAQASMGILAGAQNADKLAVTNKLAAAVAFTAALDTSDEMIGYQGTSVITSARAYLASVDSTAASLTAATATAALNASVATVVAAGVSGASTAAAGSTFTLTTGVDTTTAKNITGMIDQVTPANTTWNLSDSVSVASSDGTVNLSVITNSGANAGYNTTGVTTLKIKAIDNSANATTGSFDVGSMTGLKNVSVANSSVIGTTADTYTLNSLASGTTLELNANGSTQNVTANFVSAATAGAADTASATITGRSGTFLLGTGFETLALTGGTAGRVAAANSETTATIKTVTVGGVDLRVDAALDSTVTSIDASKATGTVNLAAAPGATFSAKGGAGTADILAVSALTSSYTITGFETVVATAAGTYDLTGTDTINLGVGVGAGAVSFTNAAASEDKIVIGGALQRTTAPAATGNLTTGGTIAYALKTATGASDTLNITVNNGGTASTGTMTIGGTTTATAVENIVINAADWKGVTFGGIEMSTTTTAVSNLSVSATASNMTFGTINLTQGTTTVAAANVINFGAVTGTTSATVGTVTSMTFTGGTGVDTITTGVTGNGSTQTYNMGAGNDVVTAAANAANAATSITNINGEAGDDTIFLSGTHVTTLVLNIDGGAGVDTLRISGGSSFIDKLENVEKLVQVGGTLTTTIAGSTTAANNSLEITQISANAVTAFTAASGQTISIAGVTALGTVGPATLTLSGAAGNETLTGSSTVGTGFISGAGTDSMTGGSGVDRFFVEVAASSATAANVDRITNFVAGTDKITIDSTTNSGAGAVLAGVTLTTANAAVATMGAVVTIATSVATLADVYTDLAGTLLNATNAFAASNANGQATVARVVTYTTGAAAGTYLVINDSTISFQAANDIVINITGLTNGPLAAGDFLFI